MQKYKIKNFLLKIILKFFDLYLKILKSQNLKIFYRKAKFRKSRTKLELSP